MIPLSRILLCCCFSSTALCSAPLAYGQEAATHTPGQELPEDLGAAPPEGHSHIGASFNEGPRQAAYLMSDWDKVHFAVTTKQAMAQNFFDQGIGQLHGFWFLESERSFRQVAAIDPDCAMAYWGMAMANVENEERAADFSHEAYKRRDSVSDREQQFIDALAKYYDVNHLVGVVDDVEVDPDKEQTTYADGEASEQPEDEALEVVVDAIAPECTAFLVEKRKPAKDKDRSDTYTKDLEELLYDYPHDIEAKAILVNHLWLSRRKGIATPSRLANEALLKEIFEVNPMHPAHHYRIHLWDSKDAGKRAVSSAARSGQSYPSIAHMWHMGGHIFASLGRHSDAAWQQEASARTDHAYMMRDGILPDQIHNFAHNNEWLTRSLRNAGRVSEAIDLAKNMIELPRHPSYNHLELGGCSSTYGRRRLIEALELYERWDELIAAYDSSYLDPVDKDTSRADRASTLAKASLFAGDVEAARAQMVLLDELLVSAKLDRMHAAEEAEDAALAEDKKLDKVHDDMREALADHARPIESLREKIEVARALETILFPRESDEPLADGEADAQVADERLAALDVLEGTGFSRTHLSRLLLEAGEQERAVEMAREETVDKPGIAVAHANLSFVLWGADDKDGAREAFDALQSFSERFELDNPPFERLAPLVNELGLAADWRQPMASLPDVGERVPLASLGPFRWSPIEAPSWQLPDGFGNEVALADYAGKPVLVIFFLGFGCVHCVEQLGAFEPVAQNFLDAGIPIVTIGTDTVEDLRASQESDSEAERLPFPVLSDPQLNVFKQYRCHDDFENLALHGTFLLDGEGRVRWHDISYEPFMDTEFLLAESQRLLALPKFVEPVSAKATATSPVGSGTAIR